MRLRSFSFFLLSLIIFQTSLAQQRAEDFQRDLNAKFSDPAESPLELEDLEKFEGLEFFKIDSNYQVIADFVRTPAEAPFKMKTSTERLPVYVKYGELYFELKGRSLKLNVYQNLELVQDPKYFDYLFVPFTDLTNGRGSYGGGRYLDLRIPDSNRINLDFNKAYNPYCAYSGRYSCPIPPKENHLNIEITAGVRSFAE